LTCGNAGQAPFIIRPQWIRVAPTSLGCSGAVRVEPFRRVRLALVPSGFAARGRQRDGPARGSLDPVPAEVEAPGQST
jgi:hypothetical protein